MRAHTCCRACSMQKISGLVALGVYVLLLMVGCGGTPKNQDQDPPRLAEAKVLASQGSYWFQRGCFEKAERYFYEALEASQLVDNLEEMVRVHNNLGAVALAQDHYVESAEHLQQALELNRLLKSTREESLTLGNLGSLAYKAGRYDEAEELWEKALTVAKKDSRKTGLAMHLNSLGMLKREQGRLDEAESVLHKGLNAAKKIKGPTLANSHMQLGLVAQARGDFAGAEKQLSKALEIDKDAENPIGIAQDLEKIGLLHQTQQSWEQAALEFDRAIRLYANLGDMDKVQYLYELLKINQTEGGVPESLEPYKPLLVFPHEFWEPPVCR